MMVHFTPKYPFSAVYDAYEHNYYAFDLLVPNRHTVELLNEMLLDLVPQKALK